MLIFLDETALFKAIEESLPEDMEDMIAFLGSDQDNFRRLASGYRISDEAWAIIEDALTSGRFMLRFPHQSRPEEKDFQIWLCDRGLPTFTWGIYSDLAYYNKVEAKSAMDKTCCYEDHSIFI